MRNRMDGNIIPLFTPCLPSCSPHTKPLRYSSPLQIPSDSPRISKKKKREHQLLLPLFLCLRPRDLDRLHPITRPVHICSRVIAAKNETESNPFAPVNIDSSITSLSPVSVETTIPAMDPELLKPNSGVPALFWFIA